VWLAVRQALVQHLSFEDGSEEHSMDPRLDQLHRLSARQLKAIEVLVAGGTQEDAGAAAGVDRVSVNRWKNHHPGFQAELNARLAALREQYVHKVRNMTCKALDNIERRLDEDDYVASLDVLRHVGLAPVLELQTGHTDADDMLNAWAAAQCDSMHELLTALNPAPAAAKVARARAQLEQELVAKLEGVLDDDEES
jgi:hypothetical protein